MLSVSHAVLSVVAHVIDDGTCVVDVAYPSWYTFIIVNLWVWVPGKSDDNDYDDEDDDDSGSDTDSDDDVAF